MTTDRDRHIGSWLSELYELTAARLPESEKKTRIALMTAAISTEFPSGAFSRKSLLDISRKFKFFPSHAELHEVLTEWWDNNRPRPAALPGLNDDPTLDARDKVFLANWLKGRATNVWAVDMQQALSVMRSYAPKAFEYVCRTDEEAALTAVRSGWKEPAEAIV